ncbi:MAG: DUF1849 family protein, partial [Bauldia sp.]
LAAYDLMLDRASSPTDVAMLTGRLVVELTGSRCAGYGSRIRFVTRNEDPEGQPIVTDMRSTTFETADGRFDFDNQVYANDALVEDSSGTARKGPDGATVALTKPTDKTIGLGADVVFPTEQIARIIEAASDGGNFLPLRLYDGVEAGETLYDTAAVIGRSSTAADDFGDETPIGEAGFAGIRHWPLTISYFESGSGGDATPAYVMSYVLYENGIGRTLKFDYGDFTIVGRMTHLKMLPSAPCP